MSPQIDPTVPIRPGATIGILGSGQLGKMLAVAAAQIGYKVAVLGPGGRDSPAGHVSWWAQCWGADPARIDDTVLREFCSLVSVVLIEWENVPTALVDRITALGAPVRASSLVLKTAQNRDFEKMAAARVGMRAPKYDILEHASDVPILASLLDRPVLLKTIRGGYDGKGQIRVTRADDLDKAWATLKRVPCILEEVVDIKHELSVIVFASPTQKTRVYGPFQNKHVDGILRTTHYPSHSNKITIHDAQFGATRLAKHLNVHGMLAVEFFVTTDDTLLFNEMAPRPHNSGHLTIECSATSQFEQYVRAACNLPFGSTKMLCGGTMHNIIGDDVQPYLVGDFPADRSVHLYNKPETLPGRKMGHYTIRHI
jgi:5-(carboxyamino)imidazole ribonucleotide synthase